MFDRESFELIIFLGRKLALLHLLLNLDHYAINVYSEHRHLDLFPLVVPD